MNDQQKIELFNGLARLIRPAFYEYKEVVSLDVELKDTGLDSLDYIMMGIYLSTLYGVHESVSKDFAPKTVGEFYSLNEQHKTQEPPETVAEALEICK